MIVCSQIGATGGFALPLAELGRRLAVVQSWTCVAWMDMVAMIALEKSRSAAIPMNVTQKIACGGTGPSGATALVLVLEAFALEDAIFKQFPINMEGSVMPRLRRL